MTKTTVTTKPTNGAAADTELIRTVSIEPIKVGRIEIPIRGLTPVIPHRWSEKSKRMMREKQSGPKVRAAREPKNSDEEAKNATYWLADGRPGLPATAFKAAIVDACRLHAGLPMTTAKTIVFVEGEGAEQLIALDGEGTIREDTPRNATGVADLRYRMQYWPWSTTLRISFARSVLDVDSVFALVNTAGMWVGVGDWRPSSPKSKTGTFGRFEVAS